MAPNASDNHASSYCGTGQKHDIDESIIRHRCSTVVDTRIVATDADPLEWMMLASCFMKRRSVGTLNRSYTGIHGVGEHLEDDKGALRGLEAIVVGDLLVGLQFLEHDVRAQLGEHDEVDNPHRSHRNDVHQTLHLLHLLHHSQPPWIRRHPPIGT